MGTFNNEWAKGGRRFPNWLNRVALWADAKSQSSTLNNARPRWIDVYNGYPKNSNGGDLDAVTVFTSILGTNYNSSTFNNACATRVSIALLHGGMNVEANFMIQVGIFKGKGFIASAQGLKNWLSKTSVWGEADEKIKGATTLANVQSIINGRNGVYIILGGLGTGITGHATLWVGSDNDVIGGSNYINYGGDIYFWELS